MTLINAASVLLFQEQLQATEVRTRTVTSCFNGDTWRFVDVSLQTPYDFQGKAASRNRTVTSGSHHEPNHQTDPPWLPENGCFVSDPAHPDRLSPTPKTSHPNKSLAANQQLRATDRVASTTLMELLLAAVPAAQQPDSTTAKGGSRAGSMLQGFNTSVRPQRLFHQSVNTFGRRHPLLRSEGVVQRTQHHVRKFDEVLRQPRGLCWESRDFGRYDEVLDKAGKYVGRKTN